MAVAMAFAVVIFSSGSQDAVNTENNKGAQNTVQEQDEPEYVSEMPPFASGTVDRVDGDRVYFIGGGQGEAVEEVVAVVNTNTKIIDQVNSNGVVSLVDIEVSDIQTGDQIVVYFSTKNENQFIADKIQVID